jgi:O-antigen/teichoic acid export membrane protein
VFVYRDSAFNNAGVVLLVASLSIIPLSFTRVLGNVMIAYGFQRVNLRTVVINTVLGLVLSFVMISLFGVVGAAISSVLVEISGAAQFIFAVRGRIFSLNFWRIFRAPLLSGVLMFVGFLLLEIFTPSILVALIAAGAAYVVIVGVVAIQRLDLSDAVYNRIFRRRPA